MAQNAMSALVNLARSPSAAPKLCEEAAFRCTPGGITGRRVSFGLSVETCTFDADGCPHLDQQLDGQGSCPASAAAYHGGPHGDQSCHGPVEMPPGGGPPPFATRMSIEPSIAIARSANSRPPTSVETSHTKPVAPCPISLRAFSKRFSSRPHTTTRTPSAASALAVPRPNPAVPAAIAAVLPVSPRSIRPQ